MVQWHVVSDRTSALLNRDPGGLYETTNDGSNAAFPVTVVKRVPGIVISIAAAGSISTSGGPGDRGHVPG